MSSASSNTATGNRGLDMATSSEAALAADKVPITVTEAAAAELQRSMEAQGKSDMALRIAVLPGGCAGMQYGLSLDSEEQPGDEEFESGGIRLVVGRQDPVVKINDFAQVFEVALRGQTDTIAAIDLRYPSGLAVRWKSSKSGI